MLKYYKSIPHPYWSNMNKIITPPQKKTFTPVKVLNYCDFQNGMCMFFKLL